MKGALIPLLASALSLSSCSPVEISEATYEARPHFLVKTETLSYFYDVRGGGISRIIDPEGMDWISFRMEPWGAYPASAASSFRGLPNLVFQGKDDGAGHPGHDRCTSRIEDERIISESSSGRWHWTWEFKQDYAILDVTRTDSSRNYWFLYEGTPGGSFDPDHSYFGSDQGGPLPGGPDYYSGDILRGNFRWMYVGSQNRKGTLYMVQLEQDTLADMISFLGNSEEGLESPDGMTVFGFGRQAGASPLLSGPQKFIIGYFPGNILDQEDHQKLKRFINKKFVQ